MEQQNHNCKIRSGYRHSILGEIGGWEAAVIRSFRVDGVPFFDAELTASTILSLPAEKKSDFFSKKIVFTRIRIAQKDTIPSDLHESSAKRLRAIKDIQKQWYKIVGSEEIDPTQSSSDLEFDSENNYDDGRREALKTLALVGIVALMFAWIQCNDDQSNGTHGSWGRSGGGYSM